MLRKMFGISIFIISDSAQKKTFLSPEKQNFIKIKVTTMKEGIQRN